MKVEVLVRHHSGRRSRATMKDVAQLAGVSRQTVSNVLNQPEQVRPSTRERVTDAINELDYRPHAGARGLRTSESRKIAVRLEPYRGGISGVILDRFLHALTARASQVGYRILVHTADTAGEEVQELLTLAAEQEIDAAVLTSTFPGDVRAADLREAGVPCVSFGRPWDTDEMSKLDWVDVDGASGTAQATRHAIESDGRAVAYLGWPSAGGTGADRERGWREVTTAYGFDPASLLVQSEDSAEDAKQAVLEALDRGALDQVGAIVCASDLLAVGASLGLREAGRDIPVIGFDNTPTAEALSFSSVEQHPEQVAEAVLELLLNDETGPRQVLIKPELVVRG